MSVNPISTYSLMQSTMGDVSKVEATLQDEQMQLSSGNAAQTFSQMSGNVQQYLGLDAVLAKTTQYQNNNAVISTYINSSASALGNVITAATSLQSLISQRNTGVASSASFGTQLQGLFQEIASQMNTQVNGQYLFSGTAINTPAINASVIPSLQKDGVPDAGYYQGNDQSLTAQPEDNTTVTYNVSGGAPAFQQLMAGIAMASEGDASNNSATLGQAETLVAQGIQGVINLQATVNSNKVEYSTIATNLTNSQLYYQGLQQTIGNTDLVSVSTQVATNQGILQAAFEAFSKISSLTLSNYLK